jgi:CheY-like chemotaxis protein
MKMPANILVIEDNPANLELVRYLLNHRGHKVLLAVNGQAGLALARQALPALILCDLQMPVLDGYQTLAALRADPNTAAIPVVAVTAFSMPNDRERVITAGFDGYLSKPIEPELFVGQIEAYLPAALRGPAAG